MQTCFNGSWFFFFKRLLVLISQGWNGGGGGGCIKSKIIPNQPLSEGLHNSIIIKFGKKVHLLFRDNVWDDNLADM